MNKIALFVLLVAPALIVKADAPPILRVHIHEPGALVADIVRLAEFLEEELPPEILYSQLGNLVMADLLHGIRLDRPMEFLFGTADANDALVMRFEVMGDGKDYLDEVAQRFVIQEEIQPGVFAFRSDEDRDEPEFVVKLDGTQAIVSAGLATIESLRLEPSPGEADAIAAMPGGMTVLMAADAIKAELDKKMAEIPRDALAAMKEAGAMLDSYTEASDALFEQLGVLVFNLDVRSDITLRTHMQARPDTVLARMIAAQTPPATRISAYRNERAFVSGFGTMAGVDEVLEPYAQWMGTLYRQMGPPMNALADQYVNAIMKMKGLYTGGYFFSVLPPTQDSLLQVAGVYEVADSAKARELVLEGLAMHQVSSSAPDGASLAVMVTNTGSRQHRDVVIDSYAVTYGMDPSAMAALPDPLNELFEGLPYHVATVDQYLVFAFGDVDHVVQLLDYVLAGDDPSPPALRGFADIESPVTSFWEIDFGRLFSTVIELLGPVGVDSFSAGLHGVSFQQAGGLTSLLRLTRDDLNTIKSLAQLFLPSTSATWPQDDEDYYPDESFDFDWDEDEE